jgi:tetratricopeptide (TPR) repeat protein
MCGISLCRPWSARVRGYWLAPLATAYGKAGRKDDALALVAEALALVERRDERWWDAEIYRVKGELLESRISSEAETCFRHAIEVARRQSAKSLELYITYDLGRWGTRLPRFATILRRGAGVRRGRRTRDERMTSFTDR